MRWYVDITSPDQVITRYCHMLRQPSVKVGQKVKTGQVVGVVGLSGNAHGPHLHFEVHLHKDPSPAGAVDPVAFYKARHLTLGSAKPPGAGAN
ncbi:MAG TPA: M23 family metallopeptidase [Actinocatenispora sp.]